MIYSGLRLWRAIRGITQVELSEMSGVHPSTISLIENEHLKPTPATQAAKKKIAVALDVSVQLLFPGEQS